MKFEEILPALREGKKIRRKNIIWQNYYGFLFVSEIEDEIFSDSVVDCHYRITKGDLNADDWEIVKKKKKVKLRDLIKEQFNSCCSKYSDEFLDQEIEVEEDD